MTARTQVDEKNILKTTESLCPECLNVISASIFERDEQVYIEKTCTVHGQLRARHLYSIIRLRFFVELVTSHAVYILEVDNVTTLVKLAESSIDLFLLDPDPCSQFFQGHWSLIELHLDLLHKLLGQRLTHIKSSLECYIASLPISAADSHALGNSFNHALRKVSGMFACRR